MFKNIYSVSYIFHDTPSKNRNENQFLWKIKKMVDIKEGRKYTQRWEWDEWINRKKIWKQDTRK